MPREEFIKEVSIGTTDAWNTADGYSKLKVLRHLIMLDRWETIAQFGTEEIGEELMFSENQLKKRRAEALHRFHATMKQLIGNCYFIFKKEDVEKVNNLKIRLGIVEEFIPKTYEMKEDQVAHEELFEIYELSFKKVFNNLQEIKDELNTPLNHSGLIFRQSDEMDLDKMMNEIVEGG